MDGWVLVGWVVPVVLVVIVVAALVLWWLLSRPRRGDDSGAPGAERPKRPSVWDDDNDNGEEFQGKSGPRPR